MSKSGGINRRQFLIASAGLTAAPLISYGDTRLSLAMNNTDSETRSSEIDKLFAEYNGPDVPGAATIVVHNGEMVFKRAYGLANLEDKVEASIRTNYRLASVTKQFTAMSILMLAEKHKLSLDDNLLRFFPNFPPYGKQIAIRHLLNHTSGLIAYEDVMSEDTKEPLKDRDVLNLLSRQKETYFPAGTKFRYSNSGYAMLALIVEAAAKTSFAQFLKVNIFDPLGMYSTVAYERGISTVSDRAYGYSKRADRFERTDQSLTSSVLGDGGIYSSVTDLFRWDQALYTSKLISDAMLVRAFTPSVSTGEPGESYGFGWYIRNHKGVREISHSGETIGFRNFIGRYPDRRFSVVVLINRAVADPAKIGRQIADMFLLSK